MFYSYSHFLTGVNLSGSGSERPRGMRHLAVLAHQFIALAYSIFPFLLFWDRWDKYWRAKHLYLEKIWGRMENQANDKESTSRVTPNWELETIPCVGYHAIRVRQGSSVFTHYIFQTSIPQIHGLISSCGCIIKWIRMEPVIPGRKRWDRQRRQKYWRGKVHGKKCSQF